MSRSGSILKCLCVVVLLQLLGAMPPAFACSCIGFDVDGFIHPDATVLPANARGVLFLTTESVALAPGMFTVATASGTPAAKVRIEPVTLPAAHPLRARLFEWHRLVRVGIEGGFVPGTHYTVAFRHGKSPSVRHDSVSFGVDPAPFDLASQYFSVQLDGPARGTMLHVADGRGSCVTAEASLVQDFHIGVPETLQRYLPALSLLAEGQDDRPGAKYAPVRYYPSLCETPPYDHSVLPAPRELLNRECRSPVERVRLRAWVGMLEVDERVVAAEPAIADFAPARSTSCAPYGMLREAMDRGDAAETATLACALPGWGTYRPGSLDLEKDAVPTPDQWRKLVGLADRQTAECAMAAMGKMLMLSRPRAPAFLGTYLALAQERLRSHDRETVHATINELLGMQRMMAARREAAHAHGRAAVWPEDTLLPLLPALLQAVDTGGKGTGSALELIGAFGPMAHSAVPQLFALAEKEGPEAAGALEALSGIVPHDPAFQQWLIAWGRRPALGQTPALVFARVAGRARPQEAVALLLPLAQADNLAAIEALTDIGPAAAPATAVLMQKMEQGRDKYVRALALQAAMHVASDDATSAATLARKLLGPPNDYIGLSDYMHLAHFKTHAADFIPVLRQLIDSELGTYPKNELRALVGAMALTQVQKQALRERLRRRKR
jgi:hypothetical protein